ncbi:MAG: hypothetical protein AB7O57_04875 [Hyphomicrobiaceae bacterium]
MRLGLGNSRQGVLALLAGVALALAACGGGPASEIGPWTEVRCVDDSIACVSQRQSQLKAMLADKDRTWVRHPATADAYAGGVRLFAFKSRKRELSCAELAAGRREADAGPAVLRGPQGKHLTPAQVSRGAMLSTEISRELNGEMRRRGCPA